MQLILIKQSINQLIKAFLWDMLSVLENRLLATGAN